MTWASSIEHRAPSLSAWAHSQAQTGLMLLLIYVLTLVFRVVHADLLGGVLAGFLLLPVSGWVVHEAAIQTVGRIGVSLL